MTGMVHESVVNSIMEDLSSVLKPKDISVELEFKVRGGITTTVFATRRNKGRVNAKMIAFVGTLTSASR
jgi:NADPH-dependent 7-cyano-7-deazaguanine reductase QueF